LSEIEKKEGGAPGKRKKKGEGVIGKGTMELHLRLSSPGKQKQISHKEGPRREEHKKRAGTVFSPKRGGKRSPVKRREKSSRGRGDTEVTVPLIL